MTFFGRCLIALLIGIVCASPASKPASGKGSKLDNTAEEMKSMCAKDDDAYTCFKFKAISFLNSMFQQDSLQLTENVEISRNSYRSNEVSGRRDNGIEEDVNEYIKGHDVTFKLPIVGSTITLGARNLDQDEIDLKVRFSEPSEAQARKSKLKKIFVPILVFVLLKAMTLIPLALGVLGLKAWNALQLSFFSFVISIALAVFQLCKKIAADNAPPQIAAAHAPWDSAYSSHYAAARSFEESPVEVQNLAYAAHSPQ